MVKKIKHKLKHIFCSRFTVHGSRFETGQSLVELLVTIGISAIVIPALFGAVYASRAGRAEQDERVQALTLARQGQEIAREVRDNNWLTFSTDGTYHPSASGSTWALSPGSETINGFIRKIVVADAYRDGNGNLLTSGTTSDPSVKYVTTTVSWLSPIPSSVSISAYLMRLTSVSYAQTTKTDFNSGTNNSTTVVSTVGTSIPDDGQVQLGAGGYGDWCNPNQKPVVTFTLTRQGIPTAIIATYSASQVQAYSTSGYNASGDSLDAENISDPPSPSSPVISNGSSYNQWKTYGIASSGKYIYTTTNHPNVTVDVEDVSKSPITQAATFNASGGGAGGGVTVSGNTGYVTALNYLYAFDVTNVSGSLNQLWRVQLADTGGKVVVNGNYAFVVTSYLSTDSPKGQLQIINLTTHAVVSTIDAGNGQSGVDVFVNNLGTTAYLVTNYTAGKDNIFVVDINDKSNPVIHAHTNTNGMAPTGITAVSGNHVIVVGNGGNPYQVYRVPNLDSLQYCMPNGFSLNGVTGINAISSLTEPDTDSYSYILTMNGNTPQLQIVAGGPGGQSGLTGTFTSSVFATSSAVFNRFDATTDATNGATINFQVAVINKVSGSCPVDAGSYVFEGPGGTSNPSDLFGSSGILPLAVNSGAGYANPGQCLMYKAYLNSLDTESSPVLYDITFSYSP